MMSAMKHLHEIDHDINRLTLARKSNQGLAPDESQRTQLGKAPRRHFNTALDRLEVRRVVVYENHPEDEARLLQSCSRNASARAVPAGTRQAGGGIWPEGDDLACHKSNNAEVGDPRRLNAFPLSPAPTARHPTLCADVKEKGTGGGA
jgi:hypothetical protein